jgi:hypothetical protein
MAVVTHSIYVCTYIGMYCYYLSYHKIDQNVDFRETAHFSQVIGHTRLN